MKVNRAYTQINDRLNGNENTYYVTNTRMKIKCRQCGTVFFQDMFSEKDVAGVCSCENIKVKTLEAPETKLGYWVTLEYMDSAPLIYEKECKKAEKEE